MIEPPEVQGSLVETAGMLPSQAEMRSSEGSSGFAPEDKADASNDSRNTGEHDIVVSRQVETDIGAFEESDTFDATSAGKSELDALEFGEQATDKINEAEQVQCSEKCSHVVEVIGSSGPIDACFIGVETVEGDGSCVEMDGKRPEDEEKREKRHKRSRRGGKGTKNKGIVACCSCDKKEKGLKYTREKMEALRFEQLDYQRKKWIEIFCGLDQVVVQEYEGLDKFQRIHQEHSASPVNFDPRPQFLKSANLGEDFKNLESSGPASSHPVDEIDCFAEEGFSHDDDDADEDYSSIQKPAFFVTGEPDFDSGPPQDGLEYLRRVRWEAARIPDVTVAKVDKIKEQSVYMPQVPGIMKCPENLLPLKEWEHSFLDDFSELRKKFNAVSSINLQPAHAQDVLINLLESANNETSDSLTCTCTDDSCPSEDSVVLKASEKVDSHCLANSSSSDLPNLSTILRMDSAARTSMLKRRIKLVEKMSTVSWNDGLWLFALCAVLDCPLHADTSAALRSLLRKCASLRAAKGESDDEVVILNILVTISGRYFGQLEK